MDPNIALLNFKTERVAETALRDSYFDQVRLDLAELGGYFPVPGTVNYFLRALLCSEMGTA